MGRPRRRAGSEAVAKWPTMAAACSSTANSTKAWLRWVPTYRYCTCCTQGIHVIAIAGGWKARGGS